MEPLIEKLVDELINLPGFGRKSAERFALQIISMPKESSLALGKAIVEVVENLKECLICHNISSGDTCNICQDQTRDDSILLLLAGFNEINKFEATESFHGRYHVLGGVISPLEGVGPSQLNINSLKKRLNNGKIREVIIAFGLSTEAETTLYYLQDLIKENFPEVIISRLAQGIPAGSEIEYLDKTTLKEALNFRKTIE